MPLSYQTLPYFAPYRGKFIENNKHMGKPSIMIPAHIEQLCNATDAEREGVGIVADGFAIDRLLEFERQYDADGEFRMWANQAETRIVAALENVYEEWLAEQAWQTDRQVCATC